ncbi:hypothetical protein CAPTEDRAFT_229059 [Capitella teleta]|uniref:SMP-30/Gluconolactonase/LRE-like region domain-containing protein n=1 Tax=Capitella teleta TaxID=283909 RepID=X2B1B3_CAPTE|nr:hypothetical protein CAPTEDRAFT_229059 [Capitella teleta]|eukprot:ELU00274.1 hypothetical protein CAPTEDRAFT_229059 [Capitella teleta]
MTTWSVEFEKVATGLPGAEGPVFTRNGRFFMVAPFRENEKNEANGDVVAVDLDAGKWERLCAPSFEGCGGIPAGLQSDKFNDLWVADMRHGILKIDTQTGKCKQVARMDSDGQEMQGCNDCIFDHDGTLWVTAPAGPIAPAPYTRSEKFPDQYLNTGTGRKVKHCVYADVCLVYNSIKDAERILDVCV